MKIARLAVVGYSSWSVYATVFIDQLDKIANSNI